MKSVNEHAFFKKSDLIITVVIIFVAVVFLLLSALEKQGSSNISAQIYKDGTIIKTVSLSENQTIEIDSVRLQIKDKKIGFIESDCPDKLCVKTGYLENNDDICVCLPNKIYIKLVGDSNSKKDMDIIAE